MVKLRLRRKGRIHHPVYDIIAVDSRSRRDGAFLDKVGFYDPNTNPNTIRIDNEKALHWLNVGAQPTDTVGLLLSYEGVLLRRHLTFKGKTQEEIEAEVEKHKKVVTARYERRSKLRKERVIAKAKAEAAAKIKAAEEAAAPSGE
ncbi:MAG: 30S ribosomal protein S16 [Candidatus Kapabacteria bacterium]|nr:30S ribosomal protein S16 [Ignavibacteriota bacterium]MCW5883728.1 30S ribosomal protein S16 [Candidatus Kapabacteria bacterium]